MAGHCTRWSEEEEAALVDASRRGLSARDVVAGGIIVGRTATAVYAKMLKLGTARRHARWSRADTANLKAQNWGKLYNRFTPIQIADKMRALQYNRSATEKEKHDYSDS